MTLESWRGKGRRKGEQRSKERKGINGVVKSEMGVARDHDSAKTDPLLSLPTGLDFFVFSLSNFLLDSFCREGRRSLS